MAGDGDPRNYFYRVCAVDLNNLTNCSLSQAGKFTRPLLSGPNLLSIPLIQSDENTETVLQTTKWDKAWSYDSLSRIWRSQVRFKPYSGVFNEVNHTIGFWINITERSNLTIAGLVPFSTTICLNAGWNLVGYPSFNNSYTVADLKVVVVVDSVEGFDGSTPPYFLKAMANGDFLQFGFGYWIMVGSAASWTIDSS